MAHRLLRDPETDGWERSDFPIVCETCLGPNPYVRMQRMEFGAECHISGRPYTKFRWKPGSDARYKSTIICQEVAKAKNVCQVCLLDLDYNLPVQVRDEALGMEDEGLPESVQGREFALEQMATEGELGVNFNKSKPNDTILKLQRTTPYYQRNKAQICSFFVKGECKRGAECPYRHEMPTTGELAKQNIKDRYFGVNDPVAKKMMGRLDNQAPLTPPEDTSITTLFVGNVQPEIQEQDIMDAFSPYGEITKVKKVETLSCAFVEFGSRADAEAAAENLHNKLIVRGMRLKLLWGKAQQRREDYGNAGQAGIPGGMVPPHVHRQMGGARPIAPPPGTGYFNLPAPGNSAPAYPSMDPQQQGTRVPAPGEKRKTDAGSDVAAKRQAPGRPQMPPQQGFPPQGYGPPPGGFGPPQMYPPGRGMAPPGNRPPPQFAGGPPPGWRPPAGGIRPPAAARPPQEAAAPIQ